MGQQEIKKTNCHFCGYLCAFDAVVEEGRVIALEPDTTRYPYDEKILRSCRRWQMNLEVLDGADRVNYPLRRVGERGENRWERVSWDDALDDIVTRLNKLFEKYGPHTLASAIGGPHASFWPLHRFMSLVGSPNNMGIGQICWNPRIWMDVVTFGWTVEPDLDFEKTQALFIWGTNPAQSDNSAFWRSLLQFAKTPAPLVVIDPRRTQVAAKADLWLPISPGTDCVLALGLINVIISEQLYDQEFIEAWCHGFEELADHVRSYTPEMVSVVCGVPAQDIIRAARIFAGASAAALISGRGIDQVGANVAPTHRAITCLRAITGNVDKPGACSIAETSDFTPEVDLELSTLLSDEARAHCLNTLYTPLQSYKGYERVNELTQRFNRRLPMRYLTSAHPDFVLRAMTDGDPYPIRALIVEATNPLLTYADTHRVLEAFLALDLIVVLEYYMTPTASVADYVLPAAGAIERPLFQTHGGVSNIGYGGPAAVESYYERRTDYDVFRELGIRMGQEVYWPEETLQEAYEAALAPAGMTWDEYCRIGIYHRPPDFFKHESLDEEGKPLGFATKTGKIELASELLEELGGQRLPAPAPLCLGSQISSELAAKGRRITLITGARKQPYNASMYMQNAEFRASYPEPLVEMSARTAQRLGLEEGDKAVLATDKGQAVFVVKTAAMRDDIISADYGWWYPERNSEAPDFAGIWESNINTLTDCSAKTGEAMIGTWSYNGIDCVVWKQTNR